MSLGTLGGWTFAASGAAALACVAFLGCQGEEPTPATGSTAVTPVSAAGDAVPEGTLAGVDVPEGAYVFSVPDMHCEFACAPKVKEALSGIDGVEKVETDVETHTATVFVKDGFDESLAVAALKDAGFPPAAVAR